MRRLVLATPHAGSSDPLQCLSALPERGCEAASCEGVRGCEAARLRGCQPVRLRGREAARLPVSEGGCEAASTRGRLRGCQRARAAARPQGCKAAVREGRRGRKAARLRVREASSSRVWLRGPSVAVRLRDCEAVREAARLQSRTRGCEATSLRGYAKLRIRGCNGRPVAQRRRI